MENIGDGDGVAINPIEHNVLFYLKRSTSPKQLVPATPNLRKLPDLEQGSIDRLLVPFRMCFAKLAYPLEKNVVEVLLGYRRESN